CACSRAPVDNVATAANTASVSALSSSQAKSSPNVVETIAVSRAEAQSKSLDKESLMAAIFPGWKPSQENDSNVATPARESTDLPATQDTPSHLHVTQVPHIEGAYTDDPDDLDFDPEPWGVVKLDELHAALITLARAGQTPAGGAYDVVGAYF